MGGRLVERGVEIQGRFGVSLPVNLGGKGEGLDRRDERGVFDSLGHVGTENWELKTENCKLGSAKAALVGLMSDVRL